MTESCCPCCSQVFTLTKIHPDLKGRLPLTLFCGHSICENCLVNIIKFKEPLECKTCNETLTITEGDMLILSDLSNVKSVFPLNMYLLGLLTKKLSQQSALQCNFENLNLYKSANDIEEIDLFSIITKEVTNTKKCSECDNTSNSYCKQCDSILCDSCFIKIHTAFKALANHKKELIGVEEKESFCSLHSDKTLEYYCKDCQKPVCMNCMFIGEKPCSTHAVVSIQEKKSEFNEELQRAYNKSDEMYRRLTSTAVTVNDMLAKQKLKTSNTQLDNVESELKQHFSQAHSILQMLETQIMHMVEEAKFSEKNALIKCRSDAVDGIIKMKELRAKLKLALSADSKVNPVGLLDECQNLDDVVWYLDKSVAGEMKLEINKEAVNSLKDYVKLIISGDNESYKLRSNSSIETGTVIPEAPAKPVIPQQLLKDIREKEKKVPEQNPQYYKDDSQNIPLLTPNNIKQILNNKPTFRHKSNSLSSQNSGISDVSTERYNASKTLMNAIKPETILYNKSGASSIISNYSEMSRGKDYFKTLEPGCSEVVIVSHINSPVDFYVQRASLVGKINAYIKDYKKAGSLPKLLKKQINESKVYLGLNNADKQWQRCRILSVQHENISQPLYHVFFIDFGPTAYLTLDKLRELPLDRDQWAPSLALHCSLFNLESRQGWTSDDNLLMYKILKDKQVMMYVWHSQGASELGLSLECDLWTCEDGVDLAQALVFHERATMKNPSIARPHSMLSLESRPKIFFHRDKRRGLTENVRITHVITPDHFYVRKVRFDSEFEKLSESMADMFNENDHEGSVYCPTEGLLVAVGVDNYQDQISGGGWYRGIVVDTPGKKRVSVLLVDTGHSLIVHWSALRLLPQSFSTTHALAKECHLTQIVPTNNKWCKSSVSALKQLMQPNEAQLQIYTVDIIQKQKKFSVGVILYRILDEHTIQSINDEFVAKKYAFKIGISTFKMEKPAPTCRVPPQRQNKEQNKPTTSKVQILKRNNNNQRKKEEPIDKGPLKLEVKILSCKSPSQIYVSLVSRQEALEELFKNMQNYFLTNPEQEDSIEWSVNDKCAVYCNSNKLWCRSTIVELQGAMATVFHVDFAIVESVPVTSLRRLPKEFLKVNDGAVKCHMANISSAGGDTWSSLTCETLQELILNYKRHFIGKSGAITNKSLPIELWVYHVTCGGPLSADKGQWRQLNDMIVEQGLALPTRHFKDNETAATSEENTFSFLNLSGTIEEWLQLEQPIKEKYSEQALEDSDDISSLGQSDSPGPVLAKWPAALKPVDNEFVGVPTFLDENFLIYLHDIRSTDTLDLIRNALEAKYADSTPKPMDMFWSVGQACIAQFEGDKAFYRGLILEEMEDCKYKILFVDYGNVEICPATYLRKTVIMSHIPLQAILCKLAYVKPKNGRKWETSTLDFVHKTIVEKQCRIKIVGEPDESGYPIELNVGKLDLAQFLLSLDFALPDDKTDEEPSECGVEELSQMETEPDYIVENDTSFESNVDWNEMIEKEDHVFMTYPPLLLTSGFRFTIESVTNEQQIEIIIDDKNPIFSGLEAVNEEMQVEAANQPEIDGVFEHKACVALYPHDGIWYRAEVLQQEESTRLIKVHYVDFGNTEIVPIEKVRDIKKSWCRIPPKCQIVYIDGVRLRSDVELEQLFEMYTQLFTDVQFYGKIVKKENNVYYIDVLKSFDGPLAYQNLIDEGVLVKT